MKTKTVIASAALLLAATANASTVDFLNAGTGVNDGVDYVGPYVLSVDGITTAGTCITFDQRVGPPYEWLAAIETVADFSEPVRTELLEAEWLNTQFAGSPDTVGIHHGIWDIFGASYADGEPWAALASANYGTVDQNSFDVLAPTQANFTQTFLIPAKKPEEFTFTPEPGTSFLLGAGLVVLARMRRVSQL